MTLKSMPSATSQRETIVTTQPLAEGIVAEYDADGQLAGIEILDARRRVGGEETLRQVVREGVGPSAGTGVK